MKQRERTRFFFSGHEGCSGISSPFPEPRRNSDNLNWASELLTVKQCRILLNGLPRAWYAWLVRTEHHVPFKAHQGDCSRQVTLYNKCFSRYIKSISLSTAWKWVTVMAHLSILLSLPPKSHGGGTTQMAEQLYSKILVLGKEADRCNGPMRRTLALKAEQLLKASGGDQHGTTAY